MSDDDMKVIAQTILDDLHAGRSPTSLDVQAIRLICERFIELVEFIEEERHESYERD